MVKTLDLADEVATQRLARNLSEALPAGFIYLALQGDLGAGKTTLVRYLLRALGVDGLIRSPTYTLLEDYEAAGRHLIHMDLYRLGDAQELDYLGVREWLGGDVILLVEWAERAGKALPVPDLCLSLSITGAHSRRVSVTAGTAQGQSCLAALAQKSVVQSPD